MDPQMTELLRALAWHAKLQTSLIIGLAGYAAYGVWDMQRTRRDLGRLIRRQNDHD